MWKNSPVARLLNTRLPLVVAPMAGGPGTARLVAAAGDAGALGMLGAGYLAPSAIREAIREVRRHSRAPFGVNLFVPQPVRINTETLRAAAATLAPYAAELGLDAADLLPEPADYAADFNAQLDVVLTERVPVFGFTFGIPNAGALAALRDAGTVIVGTATSVAEADKLAQAGVDLVCAQGAEAGGHRGTFLGETQAALVGLVALVPQVVDAVDRPVIAAGGVMDGRGIAAAFALGAGGAALGTAFLRCPEAGTNGPYRAALAGAGDTSTLITSVFSGRPARGVRNRLAVELAGAALPPYPVTNALTRRLRQRAAELGRADYLSLWAGQGVALGRELPAGQLLAVLEQETDAAFARWAGG